MDGRIGPLRTLSIHPAQAEQGFGVGSVMFEGFLEFLFGPVELPQIEGDRPGQSEDLAVGRRRFLDSSMLARALALSFSSR